MISERASRFSGARSASPDRSEASVYIPILSSSLQIMSQAEDRSEARVNSPFRNVCATLNNYTEQEEADFKFHFGPLCNYLIYGRETGESGTPHLQIYMEFKKQIRLKAIKKLSPRLHVEKRRGTAQQASDYCGKEDSDPFIAGTISHPGTRTDLHAVMEDIRSNPKRSKISLMEAHPQVCARYPSFVNTYQTLVQELEPLDWTDGNSPNLWVYGPPGTGKSLYFRNRVKYPSIFPKLPNKWWDGHNGQPVVLLEDLEPSHHWLGHLLKIWADRYPFMAEIKGHAQKLRPEELHVTSNYHPEEIFTDPSVLAAILRRFTLVKMTEKYVYQPKGEGPVLPLTSVTETSVTETSPLATPGDIFSPQNFGQ